MKKKDIIITISLIILAIITIIASFSYAFLYKEEEYDNVSMQVGTLNYNLSSTLLTNNSISLESNEKARLNIEIESLNNINTKYQLYYQTTNNNIEIGYVSDNSLPEGIINANSKKTVTVIIKNKTSSNATITFGVEGGFITNDISLELNKLALVQIENYTSNSCALALNTLYDFDYNGTDGTDGSEQVFNVPCNGVYKLETWGAQGGNASSTYIGGYGGYSVGLIELRRSTNLYINVGGQGSTNHNSKTNGGYNGGGYTHETRNDTYEGSGGGATHIALTSGVLSLLQEFKGELIDNKYYSSKNILIVAGGGGAGSYYTSGGFDGKGGSGGGYIGVNGYFDTHNHYGNGGTQISGGASNVDSYGITSSYPSGFGFGSYADGKNLSVGTSGGGSGFFGGGAGVHSGAGGGSGYIANENLIDKMMYCYDCQESSETELFTVNTIGTSNLKDLTNCPNGYSDEPVSKCAKLGNGYARITFLSETPQEEKTTIGYVITYNPNNGILDNNFKIIEYGKEIGTLPTPTRGTDYFEGWYLEDTFTTKVDSTYVPTGNITLYARYGTEINLNLSGRTLGAPSDTNHSNSTKRSFTMNTYVVGLAYNNYYQPSGVFNYNISQNSIYVKQSSGYGIGLPMTLAVGKYKLVGNMLTDYAYGIVAIVKYTSDGTSSYLRNDYGSNTNFDFLFTVENSDAYEAFVITGGGQQIDVTVSNLHLYKLD